MLDNAQKIANKPPKGKPQEQPQKQQVANENPEGGTDEPFSSDELVKKPKASIAGGIALAMKMKRMLIALKAAVLKLKVFLVAAKILIFNPITWIVLAIFLVFMLIVSGNDVLGPNDFNDRCQTRRGGGNLSDTDYINFALHHISDDFGLTPRQVAEGFLSHQDGRRIAGLAGVNDVGSLTRALETLEDFGVSPALMMSYAIAEGASAGGAGGANGWINHFGSGGRQAQSRADLNALFPPPSGPYANSVEWTNVLGNAPADITMLQDAVIIYSRSYHSSANPAWVDFANNMQQPPMNIQTAANASFPDEFPEGTIGAAKIRLTAAAAWGVYYPPLLSGSYNGIQDYSNPLETQVRLIAEWGGTFSDNPLTSRGRGGPCGPNRGGGAKSCGNSFPYCPVDPDLTVVISEFRCSARPDHNGIDLGGPRGTYIWAIDDGVVTSSHWTDGITGGFIAISHSGGYESRYIHHEINEMKVVPGTVVQAGDIIATRGNTGNHRPASCGGSNQTLGRFNAGGSTDFGSNTIHCTCPNDPYSLDSLIWHVHFELLRNGLHVNPRDYFDWPPIGVRP